MHERVVDAGGDDLVDALGLQLGGLLDIGGQVPGRAGRGVGARHREQRDALAGEIVAALDRHRPFRRGEGQVNVGNAVANLDGHREFSCWKVRPRHRRGA